MAYAVDGTSIKSFEDLIAWQKARVLTARIYHLTKGAGFAKDYSLANQIQRASVSVMANIAEGYERARPKEFHHFLLIAKGSCAEVRSHLYVASDSGTITNEQFHEFNALAAELGRIIGGLRMAVAAKL